MTISNRRRLFFLAVLAASAVACGDDDQGGNTVVAGSEESPSTSEGLPPVLEEGFAELSIPLSPRQDPLVLALGDKVLVYGGFSLEKGSERPVRPSDEGSILDVASGEWQPLPPSPFDQPLRYAAGVWTGDTVLILGTPCGESTDDLIEGTRCDPGGVQAAAFSPQSQTWSQIEDPQYPQGIGIESGNAIQPVGLGWSGDEAVFEVQGPDQQKMLLLVRPSDGASEIVTAPERVERLCLAGGSLLAVRTGQIDENGGVLSPNPEGVAQPLRTFSFDFNSRDWRELEATEKPSSQGALFEEVYCSGNQLAYWPVMPPPAGYGEGGLWWGDDGWEEVPDLEGAVYGGGFEIAELDGLRVAWPGESGRVFTVQPSGGEWSNVAAPVCGPVEVTSLAGALLVDLTQSEFSIGLLDPRNDRAAGE